VITITGVNNCRNPITTPVLRKRFMLVSGSYVPVLVILVIMAVGSIAAFFIMPPLLDKIDRVGKIGFLGF